MSDSKKIADFPINRNTPFEDKLLSDSNSFSLTNNLKDGVVLNLVETHRIKRENAIDVIVNVLSEKLQISRSGINLFRYIYINAKHEKDTPKSYEILPIKIDYKKSMLEMGYTSIQSVYNALIELLEKKIIARTAIEKLYFINPVFFVSPEKILVTEHYKLEEN
jgi:hypothetical protein